MSGQLLGYARVSTAHQSNDQQEDALLAAGVDPDRIYVDKLTGASRREDRPGLAALLDYARPGDVIVVKGVDRLGRDAAEVMLTIRDLLARDIVIRALREGVDSSTPTGRAVLGIMASLAELELELGRERREAAREARKARGLPTGRPRALTDAQVEQVVKLHRAGESVLEIAKTFRVGRDTVYRVIKQAEAEEGAGDGEG